MLANGTTLAIKKNGESAFTMLKGLKEIPDIGADPEKVENTPLDAAVKQYEIGVGDAGDMEFTFIYDNENKDTTYRILRELADSGKTVSFEETLKDKTKFLFDAQCNVKLTGGGLNGVIDLKLSLALKSDIEVVDPA